MRSSRWLAAWAALACSGSTTSFAHHGEPRSNSGPYSMEVIDEWGNPLPTYQQNARTYIMGVQGQRYQLRVFNRSGQRIEVVASVDGRDVIDGKPADWGKRGYIVPAYGQATIDGFRINRDAVAAFRFSSVRDSYAAKMGNARDVGVVGVAIFPERIYAPAPKPRPYAPRDYYRYDGWGPRAGGQPAPTAPAEPESMSGSADSRSAQQSSKSKSGSASGSGGRDALGESATAAPSARRRAPNDDRDAENRPGLGTEFGEEHDSRIVEVEFRRANARHPSHVLAVRYNDRAGLVALGIDVDRTHRAHDDTWERETARPFRNMPASFSEPPPGWSPNR